MFTPETGHTKQAILISLLSLALVLVLILVAAALKIGKKTDQTVQKTPSSAQVPAQEASEVQTPATSDPRATTNPEAPLPFNELRDISGTVTKIEGQTLSVSAFVYGKTMIYEVKVGLSTKIEKRRMKENFTPPSKPGEPFDPYIKSDATLTDIENGNTIHIKSAVNVLDKTSFEATLVSFDQVGSPIPPTGPTSTPIKNPQ